MGEFNFVDDGSMPGGGLFIFFLFSVYGFHIHMCVFVFVCFLINKVLVKYEINRGMIVISLASLISLF